MTCEPCRKFFAKYRCAAATHGECDCPKCQGYCECSACGPSLARSRARAVRATTRVENAARRYVEAVVARYGALSALSRTNMMEHEFSQKRVPKWLRRAQDILSEMILADDRARAEYLRAFRRSAPVGGHDQPSEEDVARYEEAWRSQ